jgi:hypothetical protein
LLSGQIFKQAGYSQLWPLEKLAFAKAMAVDKRKMIMP